MTNLLLDTGILGRLCHPRQKQNRPVADWLAHLLDQGSEQVQVFVPEIADYELRCKLLHLIRKGQGTSKSIERLDDLEKLLEYLPLDTETMRHAAELWAIARQQGLPTAGDLALDGDVILAAQALAVQGCVITTNRQHLSRFVPAKDWTEMQTPQLPNPPERKPDQGNGLTDPGGS
jgi:predicted nucleic acid-binding protein